MSEEKETKDTSAEETQEEQKDQAEETTTPEEKTEETKDDSADQSADEEVEVPEKFQDIVSKIEEMSVLELNELVKVFEKKFGVSAAAAAAPAAGGGEEVEEKDEFTVELSSDGGAKIPVMKAVKELLGLGLKEAKEMVENIPAALKEGAKKEEAEEMKAKIEEAGGKVELK